MLTDCLIRLHYVRVVDPAARGAIRKFDVKHNVIYRQDAFQLSIGVDNRQPSNLMFPHRLQCLIDILFGLRRAFALSTKRLQSPRLFKGF